MHSAYPTKKSGNPLTPCSSNEQAVVGAQSFPVDSPISPSPLSPITMAQMENLTMTDSRTQQTHAMPMGMESPPYTPLDSKACSTPEYYTHGKPETALPDLARINSELSPLSLALEPLTPVSPGFDEKSWDHYLKHFDEHIRDNKFALSRVKGYIRSIDLLLRELAPLMKPEIVLMLMDYKKWWDEMKTKVSTLDERVKSLEVPNLRYVTIEWDIARADSMGVAHSRILDSTGEE